ncbi:MAG: hypothetical protein WAT79_08440 [Saprospiraceae bacterium]
MKMDISFLETHYEVVEFITLHLQKWDGKEIDDSDVILSRRTEQGHGGLYELAQEWTEEFETKYSGTEWGITLEYFDTIEEFLNTKMQ